MTADRAATRRAGTRRAAAAPVRVYRALTAGRLPHCRYLPSCSEYALEAIEVHGAAAGGWMAVRRLARCHPLGGHGVDLVPPVRNPALAGGGGR